MSIELIGQNKLIEKINNTPLATLPHSIILLGQKGCGKGILIKYMCEHYGLERIDITDRVDLETIDNIYLSVDPAFYVVNGSTMTVREENAILKLLEEPPKNAFLIIQVRSKNLLLDTILNRCQIWEFEAYSKEVLKQFTQDEQILNIAKTPGMAVRLSEQGSLKDQLELADKILDRISNANVANILTIPNKIAFNEEQNKYDLELFLAVLNYVAVNKIINNSDQRYVFAYKLLDDLCNSITIPHVNKKLLFEHFLLELKLIMRGK